MRCRRLIVLIGFGVLLAGPVPAQADGLLGGSDPVGTATSVVNNPVGTATSVVNNPVGTATSVADDPVGTVTSTANDVVGTATTTAGGAVGTVTSTVSGTAGSVVGGANTASQTQGTAASSAQSSFGGSSETSSPNRRAAGTHGQRRVPGRSYHTRFDRLPRRAEILIERIELGRNMRANLRRLEALLRRSPALRAELARALRSELVRLRKGGLTRAERRQVRRLVHVQRALAHWASGSSSVLGSGSTVQASGSLSPGTLAGVESAATSPQNPTPQAGVAGAEAERDANKSGHGILGTLPPPVDSWPSWIMVLLNVVIWLCFLALAAIIVSPVRRALRELR
jgi:hypothetical protein